MNIFRMYPLWTSVCWIIVILCLCALEGLGLVRYRGAIPLTWFIRDLLPEWVRWMLLGWLLYHFGVLTNSRHPFE